MVMHHDQGAVLQFCKTAPFIWRLSEVGIFDSRFVNLPLGCEVNRMNQYRLKLYVTGQTPRSRGAIRNLKRLIADMIPDCCELDIIDVQQDPQSAEDDKILATPTLIKALPLPARRIIGDLSDTARVCEGLEIAIEETCPPGGKL
jgi:circadian clock protein KaiB